jgi:hypothetical protein
MPAQAPAAVGDTEANRVVRTEASAIKAQFGSVQWCFSAKSVPCLQSATYRLQGVVVGAKAQVAALRTRTLSPRVRAGVERYLSALDHEVWASRELYQAALSLYVSRISRALGNIRYWIAVADQAMPLN